MEAYQYFLLYLAPLALTLVGYAAWLVSPRKVTLARGIVYGTGVALVAYSAVGLAAIDIAIHVFRLKYPYLEPPEWLRFWASTGTLTALVGVFLVPYGRALSRICLIPASALSVILCIAMIPS
jgi:hypothetical protein